MLYIIVLVLSLSLICFVRKYTSQYSPASIFTVFWTVQILFMVLWGGGFLYFNYLGICYILCCLLSFDLGYLLLPQQYKHNQRIINSTNIKFNNNGLKVYYIILAVAIFRSIYSIISKGYSLTNILDIASFMEMSHQNSVDRYAGEEESGGLFGKLLGVVFMACPYVGGFIFLHIKKKKYISYLSILPSIFAALSQGAKMGLITSLILWVIGFLISAQLFNIKIRFNIKTILIISLVLISFIVLMGVVMLFRIGEFNEQAVNDVVAKTVSYLLAHLPAFDIWYAHHTEAFGNLTMGGKVFYGLSNVLGLLNRNDGVFTEMTVISSNGDVTNVYTVFRFLVEDFGSIGSLVYIFIVGNLSRLIYESFRQRKYIFMSTVLTSYIYFFILWSFATTIFAYTSYIILLFFLYFILHYFIINPKDMIFNIKHNILSYN